MVRPVFLLYVLHHSEYIKNFLFSYNMEVHVYAT